MDEHDCSFEPMDVDQSIHSNNGMDISYIESGNEVEAFLKKMNMTIKSEPVDEVPEPPQLMSSPLINSKIKTFHINLPKEKPNAHTRPLTNIICITFVVIISIIVYQVFNIHCSEEINLEVLRKNLHAKLYGQPKAIDSLISGLSQDHTSKVLILYGGTGVGKTLATSIILEHVGHYSNIYHYTMPSFVDTFTTDFMVGLTVCKNSLVIVDDLSPDDIKVKDHIINLISKTDSLDKPVTIILVYKCNPVLGYERQCDKLVPAKIKDTLKEIKNSKMFIQFETLTEHDLQACIRTELGDRKITDAELKTLLKNFNVAVDGCKGVHTKMKFMGIS